MNPLVIYHGGCWDGFCAAWIARRALGECEFVPAQYDQDPPDVTGREVYILDFSYKRPVMLEIMAKAKKVVVLDHHKTAVAELAGIVQELDDSTTVLPSIRFDMNKSGGRLAWEYFREARKSMSESWITASWLVDYTEDRDLWRWKLPYSRAINANLRSHPLDFQVWDDLSTLSVVDGPDADAFQEGGAAILRREKQIVDEHVKHATEIEMDGHKILAVNATVLFSEIAGELAKNRPFGAAYFIRAGDTRVWSLRSTDDGVDVSEIAKRHGGGGHEHAAGFQEYIT